VKRAPSSPQRSPGSARPPRRPRVALGGLALLLAVAAGSARPEPAPLPAALSARNGHVLATLDLSAVFAPALERQLGNGLTNVVAVLITVAPARGGQPLALHGRVVEILFDVWDETYAVTVKDRRAPSGMHLVLPDFAALRALLANERDLDLGPIGALPATPLVVEARVELNPISKEQLQRTREYIANPAAGVRPGGTASRSVLGAVASFLLREPDPGAGVQLLRSRPFTPAEVPAR
jgi:hypothetical protein